MNGSGVEDLTPVSWVVLLIASLVRILHRRRHHREAAFGTLEVANSCIFINAGFSILELEDHPGLGFLGRSHNQEYAICRCFTGLR